MWEEAEAGISVRAEGLLLLIRDFNLGVAVDIWASSGYTACHKFVKGVFPIEDKRKSGVLHKEGEGVLSH